MSVEERSGYEATSDLAITRLRVRLEDLGEAGYRLAELAQPDSYWGRMAFAVTSSVDALSALVEASESLPHLPPSRGPDGADDPWSAQPTGLRPA